MAAHVAHITDEMVAAARAEIGKPIVPRGRQWNEVATADGIYHAARGVGDDNPLWDDREYAGKTRWGEHPIALVKAGRLLFNMKGEL